MSRTTEGPEFCATILPGFHDGRAIILKRGEKGNWPGSAMGADDWADQQAFCDHFNTLHGADEADVAAMEVGSAFGWHVPGAKREAWIDNPPITTREAAMADIERLLGLQT